jgi:hypothetical protein
MTKMLKFKKDGILKGVLKDESSEPEMLKISEKVSEKDDTHVEIPEDVKSLEEILETGVKDV